MIRWRIIATAAAALAVLAACAPTPAPPTPAPPTPVPPASETPAPARAALLRFEMDEELSDPIDLPRELAVEALRAQGYTVEKVTIEDDPLVFVAMQRGDLDGSAVADVLGWRAIAEGSPAFLALDETTNALMLAVSNDIRECADLHGRRVAINNLNGANATFLYRYLAKNCPGTEPEYLVISSGSGRLAALYAGEADAASSSLFRFATIPAEYAANVHALVWYADEFPGLTTLSLYLRRELAEQYPETVKDIVREILLARRRLQDPQVLAAEIQQRLDYDAAEAREIADLLLERKIWDVNGGYTLAGVQRNIDWYVEAGDVPAGLRAEDVADLSFLEAVLEEIGRQ